MAPGSVNPALLAPNVPRAEAARTSAPDRSFDGILRGQPTVAFSQHALKRVERRGIDVSPQTLHRLASGLDRAAAKGARDSVVFVNGTAFVVSVSNKTVITAVDQAHMRDFVFTNIDSAVIA